MEDEEKLLRIREQIASVQDAIQQMVAFKQDAWQQIEEIKQGERKQTDMQQINMRLVQYNESLKRQASKAIELHEDAKKMGLVCEELEKMRPALDQLFDDGASN